MFSRDGLLEFYTWTNYSLDRLFTHCAGFTQEEQTREFEGFGYPSLLSQLTHIVLTEHFWIGMVAGLPPLIEELPADWEFTQLGELRAKIQARSRDFISSISADQLNEQITITFEDGESLDSAPPAYYVHHALTHAFHHKGQAVAICRLLGRPVTQDMDLLFTPNWAEQT